MESMPNRYSSQVHVYHFTCKQYQIWGKCNKIHTHPANSKSRSVNHSFKTEEHKQASIHFNQGTSRNMQVKHSPIVYCLSMSSSRPTPWPLSKSAVKYHITKCIQTGFQNTQPLLVNIKEKILQTELMKLSKNICEVYARLLEEK